MAIHQYTYESGKLVEFNLISQGEGMLWIFQYKDQYSHTWVALSWLDLATFST